MLGDEVAPDTVKRTEGWILDNASRQTRCVYEIVPRSEENWTIRWMLWHVIENSVDLVYSMSRLSQVRETPGQPIRLSRPPSALRRDSVLSNPRPSPFRVSKPVSKRPTRRSPQVGPSRRDYWDPIRSP